MAATPVPDGGPPQSYAASGLLEGAAELPPGADCSLGMPDVAAQGCLSSGEHSMVTHCRAGSRVSVRQCRFCGHIDFADLDRQVEVLVRAAALGGGPGGEAEVDLLIFREVGSACPSSSPYLT